MRERRVLHAACPRISCAHPPLPLLLFTALNPLSLPEEEEEKLILIEIYSGDGGGERREEGGTYFSFPPPRVFLCHKKRGGIEQ